VIETTNRPPAGPVSAERGSTPARVVSRSDTHVTISALASAPGRLVLLDTFYPGWRATVDGKDVHIDAADAAFRAVPVTAGRHTVRFSYESGSVLVGGIVSLVALVAIVLCIALGRRSKVEEAPQLRD
jgi:uncharacterized membrane protein YfhO